MGRSPIAVSRFCSQSGDGPFLTPLHQPQAEGRAQRRRLSEIERDFDRAGEGSLDRFRDLVFVGAD